MITAAQYFGAKPHDDEHAGNAARLLERVNALLEELTKAGAYAGAIDPDTGTQISGTRGGAGDGGFRLQSSTTGSPRSAHKAAQAVDVYDPEDRMDEFLSGFDNEHWGNSLLERHGLYREAPAATPGWCHLSTRRPASGRRTFNP